MQSQRQSAKSSNRKLVTSMTHAEIEWKRWNDRVNQQHSRARKRRRLEELQQQNKSLSKQLEETKKELEELRHKEQALQTAFEAAYRIFNSVPGLSKESDCLQTGSPISLPSKDVNIISSEPCQPELTRRTSVPTTTGRHRESHSPFRDSFEFSSVFDGSDRGCVLSLPLEFGRGAWVDLFDKPIPEDASATSSVFYAPNEFSGPAEGDSLDIDLVSQPFPSLASAEEHFDHDQNVFAATSNQVTIPSMPKTPSIEPKWHSLPLHVLPMTNLDKVISSVTEIGRQWARSQGRQHSELSQTSFPSISSLLNPDKEDSTSNPIASAVAKHTFTTILKSFSRRVAFHYCAAHLLRWLVNPTEKSYKQLPDFLRPTLLQRTVPHPAWVDTVPWPKARDLIIEKMDFEKEYHLFERATINSSINWPHSDREIFQTKGDGKQLMLSPRFITHILNINNWTNGPELAVAFPFLSGWPTSPPSGVYHWP